MHPAFTRSRVVVAIAALVVILGVVVALAVMNGGGMDASRDQGSAGSGTNDDSAPADAGEPAAPRSGPVECTGDTVSTAEDLSDALSAARPGDSIRLEPGTYSGEFVATAAGTEAEPITLCGPDDAVLDGGGTDKGYVLHLDGAAHWVVSGFSVQNGQKGVMADGVTDTLIENLSVSTIGDEAIHLRNFSTDNTVRGNTIRDTGLRKPKFGEGVYVGTAESNWCDVSGCEPDASDRNIVEGNDIAATTSESVDIKEGTSDGIVRDNTFDGSDITGADSWVDVKGNGWLIENNSGENSPVDGYQTHEILEGWGTDNVFTGNRARVNGEGFGYSLTPELGNIVECSNEASGAAEGTTNVTCSES
jgi:nitrous oxidase accessory protein NosD